MRITIAGKNIKVQPALLQLYGNKLGSDDQKNYYCSKCIYRLALVPETVRPDIYGRTGLAVGSAIKETLAENWYLKTNIV